MSGQSAAGSPSTLLRRCASLEQRHRRVRSLDLIVSPCANHPIAERSHHAATLLSRGATAGSASAHIHLFLPLGLGLGLGLPPARCGSSLPRTTCSAVRIRSGSACTSAG